MHLRANWISFGITSFAEVRVPLANRVAINITYGSHVIWKCMAEQIRVRITCKVRETTVDVSGLT